MELGRGAMGITYRASDAILGNEVALKVIDARIAALPEARERFLREARAAARLRHPNIASVFYYGTRKSDGQCFYAMELVEGETLETRLRHSGPLPPSLALEIITQAARALVALETHGLVHRDLKPANLMLVERPELTVKMIDFGLAKAAATAKGESDITHGGFVGTPSFASPEQFTNTRACRRPPLPLREPNWEAAADNPGTGQDFISQTTRYRKRCFWSGGELRRKTQFFHGKYYIYATLIAGPETERRVTMQTTKSVGSVNKKSSGHGWTCPPWQRLVAAQT